MTDPKMLPESRARFADVDIAILGPLTLSVQGRHLAGLPGQERAVLCLLALHLGRPVTVDELAEVLWQGHLPKVPRKSVQVLVYRMRRRIEAWAGEPLGAFIDTDGEAYRLAVAPDHLDAARYERAITKARASREPDRSLAGFEEAFALWRGTPVPDLGDSDVGRSSRARLVELHEAAQEDRFDALLALGRHGEVIAELEQAITATPLRERRWGQLMTALYRSGRQADALRAYQRIRVTLIDELGIEPGPDLKRLEASIIAHDPCLDLTTAESARGRAEPARASVPTWWEPMDGLAMVGREQELGRVMTAGDRAWVHGHACAVLLTGLPGMGKTRLAAEVTAEVAAAGALVRVGRATPGVAYGALREAFPAIAPPHEGHRAADRGRALTEIEYASELAEQIAIDATGGAALLVIDDLDECGPQTLRALRRLLAHIDELPVLLLCTMADERPRGRELADLLSDLHRIRVQERVDVGQLSLDESVALLAQRLGLHGGADPNLALAAIAMDTGGCPAALVQMADHLHSAGVVVDGEWQERDGPLLDSIGIPPLLVAGVVRRMERLPEPARHQLLASAVVGCQFTLDAAAVAGSTEPEEALDLLEHGLQARLISEIADDPLTYSFNSVIERQVLLDLLSRGRRQRISERLEIRAEELAPASTATDAASGDGPEVASVLDVFRLAADQARKARDPRLLAQAAIGASRLLSHLSLGHTTLIEPLREARDRLSRSDPLRTEVEVALIRELMWAGEWADALSLSGHELPAVGGSST